MESKSFPIVSVILVLVGFIWINHLMLAHDKKDACLFAAMFGIVACASISSIRIFLLSRYLLNAYLIRRRVGEVLKMFEGCIAILSIIKGYYDVAQEEADLVSRIDKCRRAKRVREMEVACIESEAYCEYFLNKMTFFPENFKLKPMILIPESELIGIINARLKCIKTR